MLQGKLCRLRPYRQEDAVAIPPLADDFLVARWMTQRFPHPYTQRDADEWVEQAIRIGPGLYYVIEVDGALAGGIGVEPLGDERRGVALFGYWLGRSYWGRGIGTDASQTLADHALKSGSLHRLEALVFEQNLASARVLEKSGFTLEGRLHALFTDRDGVVCDGLMYARIPHR